MSNQFLKLRRSAVPGRVPSTSSIDFGEIALNTFDGLAFIKRSGSMGEEVITLGSREGAFTGSFSGSFVGNGAGLFNVPASGIVGLNLSQIATGSVSASVGVGAASFNVVSGSSTFLFVSSSGNVGIGTNTPSVALQVASDAIISGIRVGTGPGTGNVYIGQSIGGISTTNAQLMDDNVFIGRSAGSTFSGNSNGNVAIGVASLRGGSNAEYNTAVGYGALQNFTSQYTTALGYNAGGNLTSGGANTIVGYNTGLGITTGASNTIIGAQITGLATTLSNTVIISDGAGAIRFYSPSTGNVIIGSTSDSGEKLQISGSTFLNGNVGIATGSNANYRVHIKGIGNTSSTRALMVENSTANGRIYFRDDRVFSVEINDTGGPTHNFFANSTQPTYNLLRSGRTAEIRITTDNEFQIIETGASTMPIRIGSREILHLEASNDIIFYTSGSLAARTKRAQIFGTTGNFVLQNGGTFTDSGERLQVSGSSRFAGDMVISGSGNTSSSFALTAYNSSGNVLMGLRNDRAGLFIARDASLDANIRIYEFGGSAGPAIKLSGNNAFTFRVIDGSSFSCIASRNEWTGIGRLTTTENVTAALQIDSITRGILIPRMTEAQRTAIGTPAQGLLVYDTGSTTEGLWYYSSGSNPGWQEVLTNSGSQTISGSITANNITVTGTLTAQTIVAQTITSSTDYVSGSTIFGNSLSNTHQFTGSVSITGSLSLPYLSTGSVLFVGTNRSISQNNANFFWDNTNGRLGIGTNAPTAPLHIRASSSLSTREQIVRATTNDDPDSGFFINNGTITNNLFVPAFGGYSNSSNLYSLGFTGFTSASNDTADSSLNLGLVHFQALRTTNTQDPYNGTLSDPVNRRLFTFGNITNVGMMTIFASGNVGINSTTDTGERLQVSGSSRFAGNMVITGSGNTSATNALTVLNSGPTNLFRVRNDGYVFFGTQDLYLFPTADGTNISTSGRGLVIATSATSQTGAGALKVLGNYTSALGSDYGVWISHTFSNGAGGVATHTGLLLNQTINQTGGANGITRGLYVNPTLTAAADFRAIEWSNNASGTTSWGLYGSGSAPNYLSGSLGIGIVPFSGSAAINSSVEIGSGNLVVASFTSIGRIAIGGYGAIGSNYYLESSPGNLRRKNGDWVSVMDMPTGGFRWHTATIGAANSVISLTQLMVLNNEGNLGLGVTSPIAKLDVRGNTFVSGTLDILDAEINYQRNNNVTTGSARLIASIPTASLNAAFFDYVIVSGSNARAGTVTSVWVSSSVEWNETYTNDIGSTSDVTLYSAITGSNIGLFATSSINNIWTIKSLIRTI
jgi:hypothetical protein